jgi:lipopolysaccharide/colanic/teichoic acid biosynthesis glycosyltransferase
VNRPPSGSDRRRRWVDLIVLALIGVPVSIVVAIAAVGIRVSSGPGNVLVRIERAGLGGRSFGLLKLRTTRSVVTEAGVEHRPTRFGIALMASGIDELPQLWNVLRGEMAIVGPRPLTPDFVSRYSPAQRRRLDVRPGLTGWAQVRGRSARTWPESFEYDVWYVDRASARLDLRILVLTVPALLRRRRADANLHAAKPEFVGEGAAGPAADDRIAGH